MQIWEREMVTEIKELTILTLGEQPIHPPA